jgi:hypothetical protein
MKKEELLATMRRDRATLDAAIGKLSDAEKLKAALDDGWSVKDVLAHISAWERTATSWLDVIARGETPERPEVRDVDATNARFYAASTDAPLAAVLDESRASHAEIVAATERLSDAQLNDKQPLGFKLWRMIDGNSAEHYREHTRQIAAWREGAPA